MGKKLSALEKIEKSVLEAFAEASSHLREVPVGEAVQKELHAIATPFHEKLKELGYSWDESVAKLRLAFIRKTNS